MRGDLQQNVVGGGLGVFNHHVEIAALVEYAGIDKLELAVGHAARRVFRHQPVVREGGLRIFVQHPHVGMRRRTIEEVVEFLDVLAMIALGVGEAEQTLLQNRVVLVPQSEADAPKQLVVGETGQSVLAPAVGAAAGMVVRKIIPSGAAWAIVFAHGAPLALAQIGSPAAPIIAAVGGVKPAALGGGKDRVGGHSGASSMASMRINSPIDQA